MIGPVLRLKRGHERARVHPWIFKGDVADVSDVPAGSVVTVIDASARFVGRGFYNPRPALCCRVLTRTDEPISSAFFRRRIAAALGRPGRDRGPGEAGRLLWSEGDDLPGLVVDRYAGVLVVQCLTLGMLAARDDVVDALRSIVGDLPVFAWDDATAARFEGFEPSREWIVGGGEALPTIVVEEGPVKYRVSLGAGQKTGLYLDQAENRLRIGSLARGRRMLDAFSYTAGFACQALAGGAASALCIESGPDALEGARANLEMNGLIDRAEVLAGNVFDELRRLDREAARFDLVVLDPPPFARGRETLEAAARGYKEINLRAMRMLEPGGILATFSCSHHVTEDFFTDVCREAAADAGVRLRVVARLGASADHPVVLTIPETEYLKGLLLEAA
jgi:23S rRNA (cytosine1962-C5)-methyltransferase